MKERPIPFRGGEVRGILAGTKTQKRVVVSPQDPFDDFESLPPLGIRCPHGTVKDRLWVRETWGAADQYYQDHELDEPRTVAYAADRSAICFGDPTRPKPVPSWDIAQWNWDCMKWRSPVHMPRWMSRITLEITDVRVERLQSISGYDARAEGVAASSCDCEICRRTSVMCPATETAYIDAFRELWDEMNGKKAPWESDPWCWVLNFRKLDAVGAVGGKAA